VLPTVKDYRGRVAGLNLATSIVGVIPVLHREAAFPCSLNLVTETARRYDEQGKRSSWFMQGGLERAKATALFRQAVAIAERIYGP